MRRLDYVCGITEDADMLIALEQSTSQVKPRQRLQLLRVLKTGVAETMSSAAAIVGLSHSQASALWQLYQKKGLEALLETRYKGRIPHLTSEQTTALQERCATGFRTLAVAQEWMSETFAITYTLSGVSRLFERLQNKKKTGRLKHYKQDLEAQEAFKKNS
jgi:transposase